MYEVIVYGKIVEWEGMIDVLIGWKFDSIIEWMVCEDG